ncbi:MAG TPA: cupredoxin domain-containing protein [Candidatus Sulfotelmatobacter sp.]|nr:cupredoxin domain-containing protein [Candidatus Sulfotelmatobacter sp.]
MNNKFLWIAVLVIVVLGLGGYFLLGNKTSPANPTQNTSQNQATTPTEAMQKESSASVSVTSSGFEPQTIKIKAGTKVVWTNSSGGPVTVNSDPHPTHTLWPFLNLGKFDDGSSVSVVFDKAGTYTYHNHFSPEQKGTVIVE